MMRQMKPTEFTDIIAAGALYRPGPMGSDMHGKYIRRKHEQEAVTFDHDLLEPILKETYGAMVYQEQVMQIARDMAGYSLGGADMLRRAMGKKKHKEMKRHREIFCSGAEERGIERRISEKIYDEMANFAQYGFNKSHAAAYGLITYQTAYLKAHYPACFYAALLTADKDNTDKVVSYIRAAKEESGLNVLPPDINESQLSFSVIKVKSAKAQRRQIRFGLGAVRNVGEGAVESILEARNKGGDFESLFDLCRRMDVRKVNKRVLEALVKCGAMDGFGETRATLFANIEPAVKRAQQEREDKDVGQSSLFGAMPVQERYLPVSESWSKEQSLEYERDVLGLYVSGHPVLLYRDRLYHLSCRPLDQARRPSIIGQRKYTEVNVAVMISSHRVIRTRSGKEMAFVTIEDPSGQVEVVCYSSGLAQCRPYLASKSPVLAVLAVGRDRRDPEAVRINIKKMQPIEEALAEHSAALMLFVSEVHCTGANLKRLRTLLEKNSEWTRQYNAALRQGRQPPKPLQFQVQGSDQTSQIAAPVAIQGDVLDPESFRSMVVPANEDSPHAGETPEPDQALSTQPLVPYPVRMHLSIAHLGAVTFQMDADLQVGVDPALVKALTKLLGPGRVRRV
ncbi:MAG TPA: hypothetical protein DCQ06_03075 [Myxococcales bacterium]|nr:hypothetical protein [Myxococcales bacterium]